MCLMCMKGDVFGGRNPSSRELLRERALKVKKLLTDMENEAACPVGDAAIELLKKEQYELARQL